jgi:hypothetical protein
MPVDVQRTMERYEMLRLSRATWESHWQEIAQLVWPDAAQFTGSTTPGARVNQRVFDATATMALEHFAAALLSMMMPAGQRWHRLKPSDVRAAEDPEVRAWCDEVVTILFSERERRDSGFYQAQHEAFKSEGAFGTSLTLVEERLKGDTKETARMVVQYLPVPLQQAHILVSATGELDGVYRCREMTAWAIAGRWKDKTPERVREAMEKGRYSEMFEVLHVVQPRARDQRLGFGSGSYAFSSCEILRTERVLIEEGGYHEMPYVLGRYAVNPRETYGRSPAMMVLPDILTLQEQEKTNLRAAHKIVDPPLALASDGPVGRGGRRINLNPGGSNYGWVDEQGRLKVQPIQSGARLDASIEMQDRKRGMINSAFLTNLFNILTQQPYLSATEALIRDHEKGQLLAPYAWRQQSEKIGTTIHRELGLLGRQGRLPPPPPAMREAGYEVEYESPSTQGMKAQRALAVTRTIETMSPFLAKDPTLLDLLSAEATFRMVGDAHGLAGSLYRTPEEFAAIRKKQEEQAMMQQMAAAAPGVAKAMKDGVEAQKMAEATI